MKPFFLFLATFCFFNFQSLASKSRMQALGNSFHLIDAQNIYKNPIDLNYLDNFLLLEAGLTSATNSKNNAEALIAYELNSTIQMAVAFGHQDEAVASSREFINAVSGLNYELAQNPIHIFLGKKDSVTSYALGLFYSNKKDKLLNLAEFSGGLSFSVEMGNFQYSTVYALLNSAEVLANKKFDGGGYWKNTVSYLSDETKFELSLTSTPAKSTTEASGVLTENENHLIDVLSIGLVDSSQKEENDFFWGAQVLTTRIKCITNLSSSCDKTFTNTTLPVWFGLEVQANDVLILRSAIKQSFLISLAKDEFGYPIGAVANATGAKTDFGSGPNDTELTAGMAIKINKLTIDGSLSTATTQQLNTNNLLTQTSLTYNF